MNQLPVVVLDPGHGGPRDSRNRGSSWNRAEGPNGLLEKDVAYDLALRVASRLRDHARVELTRSAETNPSLRDRAGIARSNNAAVFLSLHLNGSHDPNEDATDVYVAPEAKGASRAFAETVRERVSLVTGTTRGGLAARDIGTLVTSRHAPNTAACLAELAHLTNDRQARALEDESYRDSLADALSDAIREHLGTAASADFVETLGIGDGAKDAAKATTDCWKRCEQFRNDAGKSTATNKVAAKRIKSETGVKVDENPYIGITEKEIEAVVRAANDTKANPEILLALWAKEGSTRSVTTATTISASTDANAKSLFRSQVFYNDLGLDHFIVTKYDETAKDNVFDDSDKAAPEHEKHFAKRVADLVKSGQLAKDISGDINSELTVTKSGSTRKVTPSVRFYSLALILADAFWNKLKGNSFKLLSGGVTDGLNYLQWNIRKFSDFLDSAEKHRGKSTIEQWALHTVPAKKEYPQPRKNAIKFLHYVESYEPIFKPSMSIIKPGSTAKPAPAKTKGLEEDAIAEQLAPTTFTKWTTFVDSPANSVEIPIVFESFDPTAAPHNRERSIDATEATKDGVLDHLPAFTELTDKDGDKVRFKTKDVLDILPFFDFAGGFVAVKLKSVICHPADTTDPDKLPGRGKFPIAVIVHGAVRPPYTGYKYTLSAKDIKAKTDRDAKDKKDKKTTKTKLTFDAKVTGIDGLIESYKGFSNKAPDDKSDYLQEELAKHGFVSMSIDENSANFLGLRIRTRAQLILTYLDDLRARIASDAKLKRFQNRIDFERVVLIGHSRGGDAVVEAVDLNRTHPVPKGEKRYGMKSVISIAPTDFTGLLKPSKALSVSIAEAYYLVVYGSHDGDVMGEGDGTHGSTATGFRYYDRSNTHRAMAFIHGATHNRWNRVWNKREGDGDPHHAKADSKDPKKYVDTKDTRMLSRTTHETLAREYVAGWLRFTINKEWAQASLFNGEKASSTGATVSLQWKFGKDLTTVEDSESGTESKNTMNGGVTASSVTETHLHKENENDPAASGNKRPTFPNDENLLKAVQVSGGRAAVKEQIPEKFENLLKFTHLTFRVTKKYPLDEAKIKTAALPDIDVKITDDKTYDVVKFSTIQTKNKITRPYFRMGWDPILKVTRNLTKCSLATWQVPLTLFPKVNFERIRSVELSFNAEKDEPIYVDTISFVQL